MFAVQQPKLEGMVSSSRLNRGHDVKIERAQNKSGFKMWTHMSADGIHIDNMQETMIIPLQVFSYTPGPNDSLYMYMYLANVFPELYHQFPKWDYEISLRIRTELQTIPVLQTINLVQAIHMVSRLWQVVMLRLVRVTGNETTRNLFS